MIGLSEFRKWAWELQNLGWAADMAIQKHLTKDTSKKQAIDYANKVADEWDDEYDVVLSQGTIDVIAQAANQYNHSLFIGADINEVISDVQALMTTEQFYGARLQQRLRMNQIRLRRQIQQTAQIDPQKLGGLFSDPVPFGAHTNVARRMLLGTMVNAEHKTAQVVAEKADIPFVRWTLSKAHAQEDGCDLLANKVEDDVQAYIEEHNLDIDPRGLYMRDSIPPAPHPNCQCELHLVTEEGDESTSGEPTRFQKAVQAVKHALQRLRSR